MNAEQDGTDLCMKHLKAAVICSDCVRVRLLLQAMFQIDDIVVAPTVDRSACASCLDPAAPGQQQRQGRG